MHKEVLNQNQHDLLDFLSQFSSNFYLVGGTAIALQIGHRYSIDFDLFDFKKINQNKILKLFRDNNLVFQKIYSEGNQLHIFCNGVKITFFEFPYKIDSDLKYERYFKLPNLLSLAAMKAFALGRRAKYKDYVDLYFILKNYHSLDEIVLESSRIFNNEFNEKQFKSQLGFFEDIDYSEDVEYVISNPPTDLEIKNYLKEISINF